MDKIYREEVEAIVGKYKELTIIDVCQFVLTGKYMIYLDKEVHLIQKNYIKQYFLTFDCLEDLDLQMKRITQKRRSSNRGFPEDFINLILRERSLGLTYDMIVQKHNIPKDTLVYVCNKYKVNRLKKEKKTDED